MTAATPKIIPKPVNTDRTRFERTASKAIVRLAIKRSLSGEIIFNGRFHDQKFFDGELKPSCPDTAVFDSDKRMIS